MLFAPAVGLGAGPVAAGVITAATLVKMLWDRFRRKKQKSQPLGGDPSDPDWQGPIQSQTPETQSWLGKNAPWIASAGTGLTGAVLGAREQGKANQAFQQRTELMDRLAREEQARREMYTSLVLPSIAQGLDLRNPQVLGALKKRLDTNPAFGGAPAPSVTATTATPRPPYMPETEEERRQRLMEMIG